MNVPAVADAAQTGSLVTEQQAIETITSNARTIFGHPNLVYGDDVVFQKIRGFDSVRAVQFILAMEEALGVTITEEEVDAMHTMGNLMRVLRSKLRIVEGAAATPPEPG